MFNSQMQLIRDNRFETDLTSKKLFTFLKLILSEKNVPFQTGKLNFIEKE